MSINKADSLDGKANEHNGFRTMYATAAVTAGNFVAINVTDTENGRGYSVRHSTVTGLEEGAICGVATETLTAAGYVRVQTRGKYVNANLTTGVLAGELLIASSSAGRAIESNTLSGNTNTDYDYLVIGMALENEASNVGDVMLFDPFNLAQS